MKSKIISNQSMKNIIPGLLLGIAIAIFSYYASKYLNNLIDYKSLVSSILLGIMIGIIIKNTIGVNKIFATGLDFNVKKILRIGIVILGIRLSISEIFSIGLSGLPIIIACIITGLLAGYLLTRFLSLPSKLGVLIAVGTSICGASAIVATAPGINAKKEEIAYSITVITIFGILAMIIYPFLANILELSEKATGLFLGTSIHETAQVSGAGLIYDETFGTSNVGKSAITVKLVRNLSMIFVIPFMTIMYKKSTDNNSQVFNLKEISKLIPMFIIGFFLMSLIRTTGDILFTSSTLINTESWKDITTQLTSISKFILIIAMASVGLTTDIKSIKSLGLKPFLVGIVVATIVGTCSLICITIFM
jgi:uncharacterized integral membrane protein (TIGR00698 family)